MARARLLHAREALHRFTAMAPADLGDHLRSLSPWLRPFALLADVLVLLAQGLVLIITNWRLLVLELVPGVWLATIVWDWRHLVLTGQPAFRMESWPVGIPVMVIALGNLISYWCNVAFASAALEQPPDVKVGAVRANRAWLPILVCAVAMSVLHIAVVHRAEDTAGAFTLGLGLVLTAQIVLYTLLPAQVLSLGRTRLSWSNRLGKSAVAGTVGLVASAPAFLLSRLGQVMLGVQGLRVLGAVVLGVAVLIQVAGVSSTRAVSLFSSLAAREGASGAGATPVAVRGAPGSGAGAEGEGAVDGPCGTMTGVDREVGDGPQGQAR